MNANSDATLTEDIRRLAEGLLEDAQTGPIIRDAGIDRNFSEYERAAVHQRCRREPFIAAYNMQCGPEVHSHFRNMYTAIAVARRVGAGDFASVDEAAATRMIEDNKNILCDPETGDYSESAGRHGTQNFDRVIKYEDFLPILKEFVARPELPGWVAQWQRIYQETPDALDRDVWSAWMPIQSAAGALLYRYGFILRAPLDLVAKDVILQKVDLDDEAAARAVCAVYGRVDFGKKAQRRVATSLSTPVRS